MYAPRYLVTALVLCEKITRVPLMFVPVTRTLMNLPTSEVLSSYVLSVAPLIAEQPEGVLAGLSRPTRVHLNHW